VNPKIPFPHPPPHAKTNTSRHTHGKTDRRLLLLCGSPRSRMFSASLPEASVRCSDREKNRSEQYSSPYHTFPVRCIFRPPSPYTPVLRYAPAPFRRCRRQASGCRVRQIDDPPFRERTPVVHPDHGFAAIVIISDLHEHAERQGLVAAVIAFISYFSPLLVFFPWKSFPYQLAMPCCTKPSCVFKGFILLTIHGIGPLRCLLFRLLCIGGRGFLRRA